MTGRIRTLLSIFAILILASCSLPYADEEKQGTVAYFVRIEGAADPSALEVTVSLRHRWFGISHEDVVLFSSASNSGMFSALSQGPWRVTVRVKSGTEEIGVERHTLDIEAQSLAAMNVVIEVSGASASVDFSQTSELVVSPYDGFLRRSFREDPGEHRTEDFYQMIGEGDLTNLTGIGIAATFGSTGSGEGVGAQLYMDPGFFQAIWSFYGDIGDGKVEVNGAYTIDDQGLGAILLDTLAIEQNLPWFSLSTPSYFAPHLETDPLDISWFIDYTTDITYGAVVYASDIGTDFYAVPVQLSDGYHQIPASMLNPSAESYILILGLDREISTAEWATVQAAISISPPTGANDFMDQIVLELASFDKDIDLVIAANRTIIVGP